MLTNFLLVTCLFLCMMSQMILSQDKAEKYCSELEPPCCFILGGTTTLDDEFPHMVALGYEDRNNPEWLCGGSLITSEFVVTAGHCAQTWTGPVVVVRLGTKTLANPSSGYEDIDVSQIILHPEYRPPSHYNDIALLKLAKQAILTGLQIRPVCLHTTASRIPKEVTALGWGKTDFAGSTSNDLLKVTLRTFTTNTCNEFYTNIGTAKLQRGIYDKTQICAGSDDEAKDTCQGDSGGPLGYKTGRRHYIVGITSFGRACGFAGVPAVYTKISAYVKWIESIVWSPVRSNLESTVLTRDSNDPDNQRYVSIHFYTFE